ncbi:hypothetical protein MRB53_017925 [Persea americana]|uniref:Uncharacterized protein n=1 Tax=Persea americana TaxID=3435 RepID=A0ACC2M5Z4_PERAE|nr:hypothetical protein MRB53_017925 [Persea americana]
MEEARAPMQEKEGAKEEKEVDHWVERANLDEKVVARMLMSLSQPLSKQMDTKGIKKENDDAISQDKFAVPSDSKIDEPGRKTLKFTIKRGTAEAKRLVFDTQTVKEEKHDPQPMIGGSSTGFSIGDLDNGRQRRNSKPSYEFDNGKSKIEVKERSKLKLTGGRVRSKRLEELEEAEANLSSDNIKLKKVNVVESSLQLK